MTMLSYSELLREGMRELLAEDKDVVLLGEDIGVYGGAFGVTKGLVQEFGTSRVIDTPISESGFTGLAIGMALMGMRPVVEIQFMDFCLQIMDQFFNQAAKFDFIYDGAKVPLVVRTPSGGRRGYGATHSQCLEALFSHLPGVHVACPFDPVDAKHMLKTAVRGTTPTLFSEHKLLYAKKVDSAAIDTFEPLPVGRARVMRRGRDVTIFSYSYSLELVQQALARPECAGLDATLVDLRYLRPLDKETILREAAATGRVVIVEEGHRTMGIGAEIAASIAENPQTRGTVVRRVAAMDIPIPSSPVLEKIVLPDVDTIVRAIVETAGESAMLSPAAGISVPQSVAVTAAASAPIPASVSSSPSVGEPAPAGGDSDTFAVTVPRMGMNEDTVKIVGWSKALGAFVRRGETLLEVETDKATFEVEAENEGYLVKLVAEAGETIAIGAVLGYLGKTPESVVKNTVSVAPAAAAAAVAAPAAVSVASQPTIISRPALLTGKRKAVIIGAATTGGQVYEAMRHSEDIDIVGFLDESPGSAGRMIGAAPVLGSVVTLPDLVRSRGVDAFFVAIGNATARLDIGNALMAYGLEPVNAIHPRAIVAESARIGRGLLVEGNAQIGWNAQVGDFAKIDMNSVVEHDCVVGTGCHLAPAVTLGGCVTIGDMTLLNIGTVVGSNLKVGQFCISTPNSGIERDIPDYSIVRGTPAQIEGKRRADARPKFLDQTLEKIRGLARP